MEFLGYDLSETEDLLNMALTIGFSLITIFLVLVLIRLFQLLGRVNRISAGVEGIVELIHHYLWQPAKIMKKVMDRVKNVIQKR